MGTTNNTLKVEKDYMNFYSLTLSKIQEEVNSLGSYKEFALKYPFRGFDIKAFLKRNNIENEIVYCRICNKSFTRTEYPVLNTARIKHEIQCSLRKQFFEMYNITPETLEDIYVQCGSIQNVIKKYYLKSLNYYSLFSDFNIDVSIERSNNSEITKTNRISTNLDRYGYTHNFCKDHPSRKEWQSRLLEEEGITNVFQRKEVKEKSKQTLFENYGVIVPYRSKEIQEKGKNTCLLHYGYDHHMKSPEFLENFISLVIEKHGCYSVYDHFKNNNHGIVFSKPHKKVYKFLLESNYSLKLEFVLKVNNNNYIEGGNKHLYKYDILINDCKLLEINGDYYHANPSLYKKDDTLNFFGKDVCVSSIWERDRIKKQFALLSNYQYKEFWEYDINNNWDITKQEILNYANS